jgi:hypothetical protein
MVWVRLQITEGTGFTVIVKKVLVPVHVVPELENAGVTVMVAVTGAFVRFVAGNEGISPEPEAASPIEGTEFVQL